MTSADLIKAVARQGHENLMKPHVNITVRVPLDDIDLSDCTVERYFEPGESGSGLSPTLGRWECEVDLTGAKYNGIELELDYLSDRDSELLEQRRVEEFNEGPEAA